jgi:hypothetical protein
MYERNATAFVFCAMGEVMTAALLVDTFIWRRRKWKAHAEHTPDAGLLRIPTK